ncbi:AAEL001539-PA, partial [Aedes aegypti]
ILALSSSSPSSTVNGNLVSSSSSSSNSNSNQPNIPNTGAVVPASTTTTTTTEVYSTSNNENGKINVQVTVLVGTLADLKKHRSQNRSSVSPENGSLLSAQSLGSLTTGPNGQPLELSLVSTTTSSDHQYSSLHGNGNGSLMSASGIDKGGGISTVSSGNGSLVMSAAATAGSDAGTPSGTLNKFSGNTSDVVSDSTRSRRCCVVM